MARKLSCFVAGYLSLEKLTLTLRILANSFEATSISMLSKMIGFKLAIGNTFHAGGARC